MIRRNSPKCGYEIEFRHKGKTISHVTDCYKLSEAKEILVDIQHLFRTGDWNFLTAPSKASSLKAAISIFTKRGLVIPDEFLRPSGATIIDPIEEELTLARAAKMFLSTPEVLAKGEEYRDRMKTAIAHLCEGLADGGDTPFRDIKVRHVKEYLYKRLGEGAAPDTVEREKGALSKIYQALVDTELVDHNVVRDVRWKVPKDKIRSKRRVSLSFEDFMRILEALPEWYKPMAILAFYTGMRQREIRTLTWDRVDLESRIIRLQRSDTKESDERRIPLCEEAVQVLKKIRMNRVVGIDHVFLRDGHPIPRTQMRRSWEAARAEAGLPGLWFRDLRHAFKSHLLANDINPEIGMILTGHGGKGGSSYEGYGALSDDRLVQVIDEMNFDKVKTTGAERKVPDELPSGTDLIFKTAGKSAGNFDFL